MAVMVDELNSKTPESSSIDSSELTQRVAVLKRFKALLTQQRDRFRNYLNLLEKQQNVIETGSAEDLLNYVEIEEKIVTDIFSIQKVIDPLEEMYYSVIGGHNTQKADSSEEVPTLKESLEKLKSETVVRSKKNRELLSKRMLELRSEIKTLRNNPYSSASRRSNFNDANTASLVDIKG
jgi:DNA-binding transcriptional regulator GbsR (MarR family)